MDELNSDHSMKRNLMDDLTLMIINEGPPALACGALSALLQKAFLELPKSERGGILKYIEALVDEMRKEV